MSVCVYICSTSRAGGTVSDRLYANVRLWKTRSFEFSVSRRTETENGGRRGEEIASHRGETRIVRTLLSGPAYISWRDSTIGLCARSYVHAEDEENKGELDGNDRDPDLRIPTRAFLFHSFDCSSHRRQDISFRFSCRVRTAGALRDQR